MFSIDKQKFGEFVAALRREKGITQKELAARLFISDKAVSKWETGASVPNIDLLIPLAEILGVTVTELLMCQRIERCNSLDSTQVEDVVKTAITYPAYADGKPRAYQGKGKWGVIYVLSLFISGFEVLFLYKSGRICNGLFTALALSAVFGLYFCFFAKTKLPAYYDENRIGAYSDVFFSMNIPGVSFNNSNWGKILAVGRVWTVALMVVYPIICFIETLLFTGTLLATVDLYLSLFLILGGLFIPMYIVGKKYE